MISKASTVQPSRCGRHALSAEFGLLRAVQLAARHSPLIRPIAFAYANFLHSPFLHSLTGPGRDVQVELPFLQSASSSAGSKQASADSVSDDPAWAKAM